MAAKPPFTAMPRASKAWLNSLFGHANKRGKPCSPGSPASGACLELMPFKLLGLSFVLSCALEAIGA
jgi:hypothetical protein